MHRKKEYSFILTIIAILVSLSPAFGADQEQQDKKTLVSLIHSGSDPVGFMLFNLVKHQILLSALNSLH